MLVPAMDHHWLNWLEHAAPPVELAFLTDRERQTYRDAHADLGRREAEGRHLRGLQEEVRWGTRQMAAETQERLRQYLASGGEISAGDRMVLTTLRGRARERQRYWVGAPLALLGAAGAITLALRRRHSPS
jgi:hypothetical protein